MPKIIKVRGLKFDDSFFKGDSMAVYPSPDDNLKGFSAKFDCPLGKRKIQVVAQEDVLDFNDRVVVKEGQKVILQEA